MPNLPPPPIGILSDQQGFPAPVWLNWFNAVYQGVGSSSGMVSVISFGADSTGVKDSTSAFAAALATGFIVFIPTGIYIIGDLRIPSKSTLIGFSQLTYGNTITSSVILRKKAGCVTVLDTGSARGYTHMGFCVDGVNNDCHGIQPVTGGIDALGTIANITVTNCNQAFGGSGSFYSNGCTYYNCISTQNVTGISNIVDSKIDNFTAAGGSGNGLYFSAGSNDNVGSNIKTEFNGGNGVLFFQAFDNTLSNVIMDHNNKAGCYWSSTSARCVLIGATAKRNGRNNIATQRSHYAFDGNGAGNKIIGGSMEKGVNDGGGGITTPIYGTEFVSGPPADLTMTGIAMTSGWVTAETVGTLPTTIILDQNISGQQLVLGQTINKQNGRIFQSNQITGSVAPAGTATLNMTQVGIGTFTKASRVLTAWVRDLTTGTGYEASFNIILQREGAGASLIASVVFGEVGTAGAITIAGAGTIADLAFASVATDGSTFNITVTNNGANNIQVNVEYK